MIPQRAYVDLPTVTVSTLRGMRKYSTDRASANELGGTMQTSPSYSTNDLGSNAFGSTIEFSTFVKIRNSRATRMSYPYELTPYEMTPVRTCRSSNGSIIAHSRAMRAIQRSDMMVIENAGSGEAGSGVGSAAQVSSMFSILPPQTIVDARH